jgi:dTDP-4-dehydrorhamnose 3,5-epimerase
MTSPPGLRFRETPLEGCVVVEPAVHADGRGAFVRTYAADEFAAFGLNPAVAQCSVSQNHRRGTLRGLHYQERPDEEAKLVTCRKGRVFDVAVDLRPGSATFGRWTAVVLSAQNLLAIYIPEGLAHGFVTLEPASELSYQISVPYRPGSARGIRWDDPDIGIAWPDVGPLTMSERDRELPAIASLGSGGPPPA